MTVGELIRELSYWCPDTTICIDGEDISSVLSTEDFEAPWHHELFLVTESDDPTNVSTYNGEVNA